MHRYRKPGTEYRNGDPMREAEQELNEVVNNHSNSVLGLGNTQEEMEVPIKHKFNRSNGISNNNNICLISF